MGKPIHIDDWAIVGDLYAAPEVSRLYLTGVVSDHPDHADGKRVRTSYIIGVENGFVKTVSGSLYELGEVDAKYEALYPNAHARILSI